MTTVNTPAGTGVSAEAALLELLEELALELQPELKPGTIHLDAALDRDLALDSLARVELVQRVEEAFEIELHEQEVAQAESPRDLLRIVEQALGGAAAPRRAAGTGAVRVAAGELGSVAAAESATTLLEVLDWHVERHPERTHVLLYGDGDETEEIRYTDLLRKSEAVAAGLREQGVEPGQTVAIMLPTSGDYFSSFYGTLLAGAIPVPLYPPVRPSQLEDHLRRQARILQNCEAVAMITVPEARTLARLLRAHVPSLTRISTVAELQGAGSRLLRPRVAADDIAFLQYTSGSTGQPKGVVLTHQNLLTNLRAMGGSLDVTADDLFVSWLPLYHDMGLIGAGMGSLLFAFPLVLMSPLTFMSRPLRWLQLMTRHRATLSAGPNFAYELCLNKIRDEELEGLDLRAWRLALNGAEPVQPDTLERFRNRFAACGLRPEAPIGVYGLAESSLGVSFPPPGRMPVIDRIDRRAFLRGGAARPAAPDDPEPLRFVGCGFPLPGHQIRIADDGDRELPERREGHVQFLGPSSTQGYLHNPEATAQLFHGEWLDSGDLGYMAGGELFVTGRAKDIIIRAGRNLSPYELEAAVSEVPGVRKGCVAVFGCTDERAGTERLVVLAETRETGAEARQELRQAIVAAVTDISGTPPDEVVLAPPGSVLKTSSGKIRRAACRELFEAGKIGTGRPAVWRQMASLALAGLLPQARRLRRSAGTIAYTLYCWAALATVVAGLSLVLVLHPRELARKRATQRAARRLLRLVGVRLDISGHEHFEGLGTYAVAANHASYMDSIVIAASLPAEARIVAKNELEKTPVLGFLLRRGGIEFVERWDREKGVEDARRFVATLERGVPLLFFPEGTFTRMPGLLPFRMGSFHAAVAARVPTVPMVLEGTRSLLRAHDWRMHRGPATVHFLAPIAPTDVEADAESNAFRAAVALRDRVRAAMLEVLDEPDLASERDEGLEKMRAARQAASSQ